MFMEKKVLIIPSWYPTSKDPLRGSFFKEQALFLQGKEGIDIKVLFGEKKSFPLLKWILIWFFSYFKSSWDISISNVQQGPEAYGFDLPANRRVPDSFQINLELRLFKKAYLSFCKTAWAPELIHAQSGMDAGIYAHHISKWTGIPFVIIEHQVFVFHYYTKKRSTLILDAFKAATKTAAVSSDERRQVLMNQPECNPKVIWNLVDEDLYSINLKNRNKVFTVITILNSLPIKGAIDFLEAMKLVLQNDPKIRFIMVGKGADKDSRDPVQNLFIRKSKELEIYDQGEYFPLVCREQISDILSKAYLFVSPTIHEPHGIAAREAMMCGLPIVTTANGGVEDSIIPETGLKVPVRDVMEMAAAILKVKSKYFNYNPKIIRQHAIGQCGKEAFLQSMLLFYKNE